MSPNIQEGKHRFGGGVMELVPLGPEFGVEARGIGLIDVASSDSVYRSIRAALEEHSVLLFRKQEVTDDVQAAFSRAFGPLERVKIGSVGAGLSVVGTHRS
jgi:alpha-ketoglutarate-dependent 2,4-dichlorophenoxyacetate dioxygenase